LTFRPSKQIWDEYVARLPREQPALQNVMRCLTASLPSGARHVTSLSGAFAATRQFQIGSHFTRGSNGLAALSDNPVLG
jgi:hypothetical protein